MQTFSLHSFLMYVRFQIETFQNCIKIIRYVQNVWSFWLNDVNVELKFPQGPGINAAPPRRVALRCKELELKGREVNPDDK